MTIYALHGFLGSPSDWNFLQPNTLGVDQIIKVGILSELVLRGKQNILMGYSLGGRLALSALTKNPSLWKAAVIISAHPGLTDENKKQERLQLDKSWAKRFLEDPWEPLLQDWNAQKTLATSRALPRKEQDYDRAQLAFMLETFSLGHQKDFRPDIATFSFPVLWIVGEMDKTYISLAATLSFVHPLSRVYMLPQSGHRAPWDQPQLFEKELRHWLSKIL